MDTVRERLLIYPYDIEFTPILRHKYLLDKFDGVSAVSPSGWGLAGKDAGYADGGSNIGINISSCFSDNLDKCDTVLIAQSSSSLNFMEVIYPKILEAVNKGKNILCSLHLDEDIKALLSDACNKKGVYFKYLNSISDSQYSHTTIIKSEILKIDTPVIFVLGVSERLHKFETQLNLRKHFSDMGYKVSQIGSRTYCDFLGFHSFPRFMYSTSIDERKKILLFNRFVKDIEQTENPDVIIIGVPGGIMSINDKLTNNFGVFAFEVSQAIEPDAIVMSLYYDEYWPEFFNDISIAAKYKLGNEIDCFTITNIKLDDEESKTIGEFDYLTLDYRAPDSRVPSYNECDIPVFNPLQDTDMHKMQCYLVDRLSNY